MKTLKKVKSIAPEHQQFQLSFVLGGNHTEALQKLQEIKDSMVEIMMIDKEVEIGLCDESTDIIQLVYLEADLMIRRFKKEFFSGIMN